MFVNKTIVRVRYADTDKMQVVYNGKYVEYFEIGRTELLREAGLPYKSIEERGYQLPVIETKIRHLKPAFYDDLLEIEASVKEPPKPKIHIDYIIKKIENGDIVAEGYTEHAFISMATKRAVKPPQFYIDFFKNYLESSK